MGIGGVSLECSWKTKETKKRRIVKNDVEGCFVGEGSESMEGLGAIVRTLSVLETKCLATVSKGSLIEE